jgi:hypothetical protein
MGSGKSIFLDFIEIYSITATQDGGFILVVVGTLIEQYITN